MEDTILPDREAALRCVDENEILYDNREKYFKRIKAAKITFPEELYGELLRSVKSSQDVFLMYLKQQIILHEPRVRYNPLSNIAGLDEKIQRLSLSSNVKRCLREISSIGYKCLKDEDFLTHLVEFDIEQPANVVLFDKSVELVAKFDLMTLINKEGKLLANDHEKLVNKRTKGKLERARSFSSTPNSLLKDDPGKNILRNNHEEQEITQPQLSSTSSISSSSNITGSHEQAVINIILTPRNYLHAADLYRLLIFSCLKTISKFYCFVLHIGPLADTQELVLYEFTIPEKIVELITSYDKCKLANKPNEVNEKKFEVCLTINKTSSMSHFDQSQSFIRKNVLNLNRLESVFRNTFGKQLQTVADLSEYFRYYINDCTGIKNHLEDKKDRYERYMAKKAAKRERKLARRLTKESTLDSGICFE